MAKYYRHNDTIVSLDNINSIVKSSYESKHISGGQPCYACGTNIHIQYTNNYKITVGVDEGDFPKVTDKVHALGDKVFEEISAIIFDNTIDK